MNPMESDNWVAITFYDNEHNNYELKEHEYVICNGKVFYPEIDVYTDIPKIGTNLTLHDTRNYNLKLHSKVGHL